MVSKDANPTEKDDTEDTRPQLKIKFWVPDSWNKTKTALPTRSTDLELGLQELERASDMKGTSPEVTDSLRGKHNDTLVVGNHGPGFKDSDSDCEIVQDSRAPVVKRNEGPGGSSNSPKFIHYRTTAYKRKDPIDNFLDEDSTDELNLTKPEMKKARRDTVPKSNATRSRPNCDENPKEDAREFTVYLQVWSTVTTTEPKRLGKGAKTTTTTSSINKGPFKFDTSRSFAEFQSQPEVAAVLPCRVALLPVLKFEWKFDKEARSAPRKKIADVAGYEALVDAIKKKRATENVVVWMHLPKPAKEENDWDTGKSDHIDHPFDFDEEDDAVESTKGLIAGMMEKRSTALITLENKYPVGNFPMFPDKRIWQNKLTDSYFELTRIRMKVWANGIASKKADLSAPPTCSHFTEDKRIKVPVGTGPPGPAAQVPMASESNVPAANIHPFYVPFPPTASHGGYHPHHPQGPGPYYMPLYNMPPTQMLPGPPPAYPYPYLPPQYMPTGTGSSGTMQPPFSPGTPKTLPNISLAEFCAEYGINESNQAKLAKLEYQPGNRDVERLDERDW